MEKKYLITSALPYINGVKHLGNLVGSILPADVYAKFLRQEQKDVLYICGTDEHGTPAEIAAAEAGRPIADYCHDMFELQKSIYEKFDIEFDYFGRSSSPANHKITTEIFQHLKKNGFIFEKTIHQYYSHVDGRYLPDRYVEGTCPHCGFAKARGDQCDGCGTLLEPENLLNPYSSISGSREIELQETRHFFLDLTQLQTKMEDWISEKKDWPDLVKGTAKKWLGEGLQARCITRDLKWGIPVAEAGFEDKVFYVWFDAPNGYISITMDWAESIGKPEAWKDWWMNSDHVRYTQFMAKDNIAFHAIFWPGVLFGADMGFHQVDYIKGFHWLNYEKGKFSTSQKRGLFTDRAIELYPADYWRYYLMTNCPEGSDSDFTFAHFAAIVNKDLADILGNFCNRALSLFEKYFESTIPHQLTPQEINQDLYQKALHLTKDIESHLAGMKFRHAVQSLRALWVLGNEYITEAQPWSHMKTDPEKASHILIHCVHLMRLFAITSHAIIPQSAKKILRILNDPTEENLAHTPLQEGLNFSYFKKGHVMNPTQKLFEKVENEAVERLTAEFAGQ